MIAVNPPPPPPLKFTAQRSNCNPNPTRIHHNHHHRHRHRRFPGCFTLSSRRRSGDFMLPVVWSNAREFVQRLRGGHFWIRLEDGLTAEASSSNVGGGEYVYEDGAEPDHLVIMVNGINGSDADWRYAQEQFVKNLPKKVFVHCSACNYARLTFDGVDTMGERLAEEVRSVVRGKPKMQKISFVAHSLGGLVARYAIGRLYKEPSGINGSCLNEENTNNSMHGLGQHCGGKIAGLVPMNFVTVATPHLGSKGHKQLPFLCGLSFLEKSAPQTAHLIVGRSGKHLFLTDDEEGKPLLLRMVNDSDDLKFISALRAFKRRVAYANANYDHMVGWRTSSIRRQSELPKSNQLVSDEKYPHIVHIECGSTDVHKEVPSEQMFDWEEEMIRGLTKVSWERVDVSFQKSRQRFIAHNTIQVKRYWLNSDGADVVSHIIDNFLLDLK
ncbi:putative lipase C4A8.10 [Humulus lupulus]|uniref:putative lipase C4A8.10 n=1 Tax=Humulus lupulus TaxID=3486 RepID=UPI002B40F2E8|nr:putative lipase C4A8.10 [Humulus lupulus]